MQQKTLDGIQALLGLTGLIGLVMPAMIDMARENREKNKQNEEKQMEENRKYLRKNFILRKKIDQPMNLDERKKIDQPMNLDESELIRHLQHAYFSGFGQGTVWVINSQGNATLESTHTEKKARWEQYWSHRKSHIPQEKNK